MHGHTCRDSGGTESPIPLNNTGVCEQTDAIVCKLCLSGLTNSKSASVKGTGTAPEAAHPQKCLRTQPLYLPAPLRDPDRPLRA